MAIKREMLRIIGMIGIMFRSYSSSRRILSCRLMSSLLFSGFLILLCGTKLQAQVSLQEIVRFDIPIDVEFMSIANAGGDINGDGRPDLVFGCWANNNTEATIYIYHSIPDSNAVPDQVLSRPPSISGGFGHSIAYAGDLNGDGISDLVVGIEGFGFFHQGAIAIYWGGATLSEQPDVFIDGLPFGYTQSWDLMFGQNLITDSDINGDGINDLLVYAEGPQWEQWGNVYVFLGGSQFSTTPALHIRGNNINEHLGINMQAGDINGDGFDDIVLSNRRRIDPQSDLGYIYELKVYAGGTILSDVPVYEAQLASGLNYWVKKVISDGDLNGDGYNDIVIHHGDQDGNFLRIIYGQTEWSALTLYETVFQVSESFWLRSYCNLNDDPYSDIIVYSQFIPGTTEQFGTFCVFKQTSPTLDLDVDYVNVEYSVTHDYGSGYELGDINQDGFNEFIVWGFSYPSTDEPSYATILTEQHVGVQDDVLPLSNVKLDCYPNPFRDALTISLNANNKRFGIENVKIYDLRGRLVYETSAFGSSSYRWDGKDKSGRLTSSGIYLIRATDKDKKTLTSKVVRVK